MKKVLFYSLSGLFFILCSCGSKEGKAKEFAVKFADFVNSNQMDSIMEAYPAINFDSIEPLSTEPVLVAESGDGLYKVDFSDGKWVVVKVGEDGKVTVTDTKGIAAFPKDKYELAVKTGMLTDSIPDTKAQELLNDGAYFEWLVRNMKQPVGLVKGKISKKSGVDLHGRPCEGAVERMTCTVTNNTPKPISGKDYAITYAYSYWTCSDGSSPDGHTTGKKDGVDLAPGQSADINIAIMDYGLKNVAVKYNVPIEQLTEGMDLFSGREYQQYLKERADKENVNYDWLSTREATPQDLENKSQDELRIMRNWIYARHGYIFKSQDLTDYFSNFSWYTPTSKNVTSQLNKIELANIKAIQAYE